jgi:hypothetical protein
MNEPQRAGQITKQWLPMAAFAVVCLLLGADSVMKLLQLRPAVEANAILGFDAAGTLILGVILSVCLLAYLVPVSRYAGALLLTAYLGGAVAIHVRAHSVAMQVLSRTMILMAFGSRPA